MKLHPRRFLYILPFALAGAASPFLVLLLMEKGGEEGASEDAYAGSETCRDCHAEVYSLWKGSQHALAEEPFDPSRHGKAFGRGDGDTGRVAGTDGAWSVRRREGGFEIVAPGPDGRPSPHEPARVIGLEPLWQPVVAFPRGRYQVSSLAYDPERDEWFDATASEEWEPGEIGFWTGRAMTWNSSCAPCHVTDYRKNYDPATDSYDTAYLELGVGCEACHGPRLAHVEAMRREGRTTVPESTDRWDPANFLAPEADAGSDPVPFVETPDFDPVLDTCGSCHSRRADLTGAFRPGDRFLDHYRPDLPGFGDIYYADGQVREEDYEYVSFLSSRMYLTGVRCLHCHDPHSGKLREEGNDLCLDCHREKIDPAAHSHHDPSGPGGQCVDCHMPITLYMERDPRRDHGFTIPDPRLTLEEDIPNACNRCHDDRSAEWALEAVERWYGDRMDRPTRARTRIIAGARRGEESALEGLLGITRKDSSPLWRAVATGLLSPWASSREDVAQNLLASLSNPNPLIRAQAARAVEPYVALPPRELLYSEHARRFVGPLEKLLDDPVRLVRLEAAWALRMLPARGTPVESLAAPSSPVPERFLVDPSKGAGKELHDYLRYSSDHPPILQQQAVLMLERGRPREAVRLLEQVAEWNPTDPGAHRWLAVACTESGMFRAAVRAAREAFERARELQSRGVLPEDPSYAYDLGLALGQVERHEEAEDMFELAAKTEPRFAPAWFNLAQVRWIMKDHQGALEAIVRAEELDPRNPRVLGTRAALHRKLGQEDMAELYDEKARSARTDAETELRERLRGS